MNIGDAARATGLSAKMIRYYEQIGLIAPAARSLSGYRHYAEGDIAALTFISRCRRMGFGVEQIRDLLGLWRDPHRASADVKAVATGHAQTLAAQARELQEMSQALQRLAASCHGDDGPDCAILDQFATLDPAPKPVRRRAAATRFGPARAQGQLRSKPSVR